MEFMVQGSGIAFEIAINKVVMLCEMRGGEWRIGLGNGDRGHFLAQGRVPLGVVINRAFAVVAKCAGVHG